MSERIALLNEGYEFLWYSYFHESYNKLSKDSNKALEVCVERAYLDLCRTLTFNTDDKEKRNVFRNSICTEIVEGIKESLLNNKKSSFDFDDEHLNLSTKSLQLLIHTTFLKLLSIMDRHKNG